MPKNHSLAVNATCSNEDDQVGFDWWKFLKKWISWIQVYMYGVGSISGPVQSLPTFIPQTPPIAEKARENPVVIVITNIITNIKNGYVYHVEVGSGLARKLRAQPSPTPTPPNPDPSPKPSQSPKSSPSPSPTIQLRPVCPDADVGCEKYDIPDWPIK